MGRVTYIDANGDIIKNGIVVGHAPREKLALGLTPEEEQKAKKWIHENRFGSARAVVR